jgi:hypothetical protein
MQAKDSEIARLKQEHQSGQQDLTKAKQQINAKDRQIAAFTLQS